MVLEATMVCVDNSEWMRNGDLNPTRFEAQTEAINLLAGQKTNENPENTVGILTLAGKGPRVLVTPTSDLGKILGAMHDLGMEGETNICVGVQVAQLALKHRQNKNQRQRIVLFTGSPIGVDQAALVKIGKKLKKNNVAVDIVCFGDLDEENTAKLDAFLGAVNSNENSHLVNVPLGAVLADCLLTSPICQNEDSMPTAGGGGGGGGGDGFEFGVDPNMDPELALALRVSMEEERARQEAANKAAAGDAPADGSAAPQAEAAPVSAAPVSGPDIAMDDDALLQQALALSMAEVGGDAAAAAAPPAAPAADDGDEAMALAIQMSMADAAATAPGGGGSGEGNMEEVLGDAAFVNSVLASLPGVDPNDPSVRDMLASLGGQSGEGPPEAKKEEDK